MANIDATNFQERAKEPVEGTRLRPGTVQTEHLAAGSVTNAKLAAATITTASIAAGTIVDANVSATAALAYSKLALTGSVKNADLSAQFSPFKVATFLYDFAALGGLQGALTLTDTAGAAQTLPDNAVIVGGWLEQVTALTSGGSATVALGVTGTATKFLAATAFNNAAFNTTDTITALSGTPFKLNGAKSVIATVAVADLTAGAFRVHVQYREGA